MKELQAAAASADWKNAPGFYEILTDEPGKTAGDHRGDFHPDAQNSAGRGQGKRGAEVFDWAYQNGDAMALELDYIPMPMMS